jgi:hypothetical protein
VVASGAKTWHRAAEPRHRAVVLQGPFVAEFKNPSFQDRIAAAAAARQKALERLKAKPPVDEAVVAERRRAQEAKEQALAEERARKAEARAAEAAAKAAAKEAERAAAAEAAAAKAAPLKIASAAEMKAARDARYAARKARK